MSTSKPKRKRKPKPVEATREKLEEPEWGPLVNHVGPFLARWFMYMGTYRLADGGRLHAYKHVTTRRYFHIHDDLRCFAYTDDDRYLEVRREPTMFLVFADYSMYPQGDEEEHERYRDAVRVAEYLAWLRDRDPEGEAPPTMRTPSQAA